MKVAEAVHTAEVVLAEEEAVAEAVEFMNTLEEAVTDAVEVAATLEEAIELVIDDVEEATDDEAWETCTLSPFSIACKTPESIQLRSVVAYGGKLLANTEPTFQERIWLAVKRWS